MNIFDTLVIISFSSVVFLFSSANFLYKKLLICLEEITEIKRLNEKTSVVIQDLSEEVYRYRLITEDIQDNQKNLDESFKNLEDSFKTLKETATELQSAHQTKKAVLDFMKR